jgi:2-oxoglutarate ferredoxin oxidoreductase subunit delta
MPKKFGVRILGDGCKGCGICVHFCPNGVLKMSGEFTPKGYHPPQKKTDKACKGCRTCEQMCPDLAIYVEEEGQ